MKRVLRWIGCAFLIWIVLVVVEGFVLRYLDKSSRADRETFREYIDNLPPMLDGAGKGFRFLCNYYQAGLIWRYRICLSENPNPWPEMGCEAPHFEVIYHPPRPFTFPDLDETHFRPFSINPNKEICHSK